MPSHVWGDAWFEKHGRDLDSAISYCTHTWRTWGRIGCGGSKEKYGTFRDNVTFYSGWWAVHDLVKPGYRYYQWGKKLMNLEILLGNCVRFLRLDKLVRLWQYQVYNFAIQQACKRYPAIVDEIVADLDYYHLVKPGIFGDVDGTKIHNKYWTRIGE